MIFCAVAAPTPGRVSSVARSAVFTFTLSADAAAEDLGSDVEAVFDLLFEPKVTLPSSASALDFPNPLTFSRSDKLWYGRPSIIFWAVDAPTPGSVSKVAKSAVLTFTGGE